ncbi:MAG TPA: prolipoprotein diacylglyceryl transferase family protein [Candidatus Limnocylindrales bacterium]
MPVGVITFDFDPVVKLGDSASVRLETLALAVVLFLGLLLAAAVARRTPAPGSAEPAGTLRADDLVFIVIGAVPGALLGGRIGYVLDHLPYYRDNTGAITDFSQGALGLTVAVPLAILSGGIIARLIGAPVGRWLHATAVPLLAVLAMAKLSGVLGATGQGLPATLPWATAYAGPGPWGSLAPDVASHPSQVYEAVLIGLAIVGLIAAGRLGVLARGNGGALYLALGLWALARFVVAFTWRDPVAIGPLRIDQVLSLLVVALAAIGLVERSRAPILTEGWATGEAQPGAAE